MGTKFLFLPGFFMLMFLQLARAQKPASNTRTAFIDKSGVVRWTDNNKEVALFGANYCLPSACDYRAAGYVTNDRKKMVDQDMAHFARMGFDALRLSFWGDYENTDKDGNLLQNDHLDLLDYVVAKAKERGVYILLSPIVTYSSLWPDANQDTASIRGISTVFKKSELGTNPKAIAAECNYLRQLLNHVNPYTGMALKDDPSIVFVELINEPWHHSDDVAGSVKYINAMVDAIRSTGCKKVLFHNLSQDFNMAVPIQKSEVQGVTFAWYPSGLNSGHTLTGNYLPVVDEYSKEMLRPELKNLARIVYEFDSPDLLTGYMYPAMARSFRRVGAQWASIFSYDMLQTAPYNLGWQTHYINMVYTPTKSISAMIAAEVMKTIPRYKDYGKYPLNTSFGPFKLNYQSNLGELNSPEKFYYTNDTRDEPVNKESLSKIVGHGSSPVVSYEGKGLYFLDKINKDTWRLEVYPDAVQVDDPFKMPSPGKVVTRSISRLWPMQIELPGLGNTFQVIPLNDGNNYFSKADHAHFEIKPGVYILTSNAHFNTSSLPQQLGYVKMKEFVSLPDQDMPMQVISQTPAMFPAGHPLHFSAEVVNSKDPQSVTLFLKTANSRYFLSYPMKRSSGYTYGVDIPYESRGISPGGIEYCIVVKDGGTVTNFPSLLHISPYDWNYYGSQTWKGRIIDEHTPYPLVKPEQDQGKMDFTRIGDGIRQGVFKMIPSTETSTDAIQLELPLSFDRTLDDYTVSIPVKDKIIEAGDLANQFNELVIDAKGKNQKQNAYITLVENDGTSWSTIIPLQPAWQQIHVQLDQLKLSKGAMLPLGYPGRWKYWFEPASGRGGSGDHVHLPNVERVQISMRQAVPPNADATDNSTVAINGVELRVNKNNITH